MAFISTRAIFSPGKSKMLNTRRVRADDSDGTLRRIYTDCSAYRPVTDISSMIDYRTRSFRIREMRLGADDNKASFSLRKSIFLFQC